MPDLTFTRLAGSAAVDRLLVVGPSLGTSVEALWGRAASRLGGHAEVVGWDLPGHGRSAPADAAFSIVDVAAAVRDQAAALAAARPVSYGGVSIAGAVALCLALDPGPLSHVLCIASAAKHGGRAQWIERAALVRSRGTGVMTAVSAQRWFADGFAGREPAATARLLRSLADADADSYALACEALADFDLRSSLDEVRVPLIVVAGSHDSAVPAVWSRSAAGAAGAGFVVLENCAHLPRAEVPDAVASLLTEAWEGASRA